MNKSTKQYIEIIDYYPSIIRSDIPLVHFFMFVLYYFLVPFYILYTWYKKGKPLSDYFHKKTKEVFDGPEATNASFFDFEGLEITLPKEFVVSTENTYFYDKDAKNIIKSLVQSGEFKHIEMLSNKYIVKIRNVMIASEEEITSSRTVILAYPKLAMSLYKIFKPILK